MTSGSRCGVQTPKHRGNRLRLPQRLPPVASPWRSTTPRDIPESAMISPDDDGRTFTSPHDAGTVSVFGSHNALNQTIAQGKAEKEADDKKAGALLRLPE